jgi:uncharacterized membrane protein (DUF106 family)
MSAVNRLLAAVTDIVLAPFSAWHPLIGLSIVSLATAVVMLVVFKRTSNQGRLAAVKRSIHAGIFEIRLYNDDLRAILRAQRQILRDNLRYLWLSLLPMVWVIVPLVLVIAQLQFYYGYSPVQPGSRVLLKVQLRDGATDAVSLDAPSGVRLGTPAVRLPAVREVMWGLEPSRPGHYALRLQVGGYEYLKALQVGGGAVRRSPLRLENTWSNQLLYPSEPPLPAHGPVTGISFGYEEADVPVFGWNLNWMVVYFGLSLIFAVALKKPLGVTI